MSTILCIARHPIDLAGGDSIHPGEVKTGVDLTNSFNAGLLSHHLIYQLPDNYTTGGSSSQPWTPEPLLMVGDVAAHLASVNPTPLANQVVVAIDTGVMKLGDGATRYVSLPTVGGGGSFSGTLDGGTP